MKRKRGLTELLLVTGTHYNRLVNIRRMLIKANCQMLSRKKGRKTSKSSPLDVSALRRGNILVAGRARASVRVSLVSGSSAQGKNEKGKRILGNRSRGSCSERGRGFNSCGSVFEGGKFVQWRKAMGKVQFMSRSGIGKSTRPIGGGRARWRRPLHRISEEKEEARGMRHMIWSSYRAPQNSG